MCYSESLIYSICMMFEYSWILILSLEVRKPKWILMMAASYVFVSLEEPCFGIVQEVNTLKPPSPLVGHLCSTVVNTRDAIYSSLRQEHALDTQQKLHSSEESFIKLIISHVENATFFVWSAESYQWYSLIQLQGMLDHVMFAYSAYCISASPLIGLTPSLSKETWRIVGPCLGQKSNCRLACGKRSDGDDRWCLNVACWCAIIAWVLFCGQCLLCLCGFCVAPWEQPRQKLSPDGDDRFWGTDVFTVLWVAPACPFTHLPNDERRITVYPTFKVFMYKADVHDPSPCQVYAASWPRNIPCFWSSVSMVRSF